MERIDSLNLSGVNAYFTNFDNRIVSTTSDKESLKKSIERTLKVLLLTKNNVVCAASHLTNDIAFKLLSENKVLLNKQLIIPAFRSDKTEIAELFHKISIKESKRKKYIDFYSDNLTKTVSWDLHQNSNWFRDTFVQGLNTKGSVICKNLKSLSDKQLKHLISEISKKEILDRDNIDNLSKEFDNETKLILRNYRELIYHMSGARVVNSESTLPQENYIDYSLTDFKNRDIQLSELQVFWKIFIELLYETLNKPKLSEELLDILSFDDIANIRQPILETNFVENYNNFYKIAVTSINKKNEADILFDLKELLKIKNNLEFSFKEVFEKELKSYFNKKAIISSKGLLKNTVNMGIGFIPWSNLIGGTIGILNEFKSFQINLFQTFKSAKSINDYDNYTKGKERQIIYTIDNFNSSDKTELIDVINLITKTISQKIQL
jgi:hypothetical protein